MDNTKPPAYNPNFQTYDPPPSYNASVGVITSPPPGTAYIQSSTASTTFVHPMPQQSYGTVPVIVTNPIRAADIVVVGGCPVCRIGVLRDDFTLGGLCCAFWFFPIGLLCCLAMKERRCSNCGAIFS